MPKQDTLERFIARVESNAHVEACEEFYTEHSTMQENFAPPRIGRDAHVANERKVMARAATIVSKCVRPVFVDGTYTRMEELAYQRWEGERISEEQFFYDPAQRTPRRREG